MKTMMKLFVMLLVVAVLAPAALATFNAGDVRIWTWDSRQQGGGATGIYRSNVWPVGGTTTMQFNAPFIDSAGNGGQTFPADPAGWDAMGNYVYITAPTAPHSIRRYDLDGKIAPLGLNVIQPGDFTNEVGGFRGIAANDTAGRTGLYVSDSCPACPNDPSGEVRRYNLDGSFKSMFYEKSNPRASAPWGVLAKNMGQLTWFNGRLYVQNIDRGGAHNFDIGVFDSDGTYLGDLPGGPITNASTASRLAIRPDGTLFVLDRGAPRRVRTWKLGTAADLSDYVDQGTYGEATAAVTPLVAGAADIDIDPRTGALIMLALDTTNSLNKILQFGSQTGDFIQEVASWNTSPGTARQILIVPEPATLGLLTLGGFLILRRRR